MKMIVVALSVGTLLIGAGCSKPADDATDKRVGELEARVQTLEAQNKDVALKARIVGGLGFQSPLDNFFESDEFWENPYDSGQADCSKGCITALTSQRKTCAIIEDASRRLQCYQDATDRASNCHRQCSGRFPPTIP